MIRDKNGKRYKGKGKKMDPKELHEYRVSLARSIQPMGAAARRKAGHKKDYFDPSGGINHSKYDTYEKIISSGFNDLMEQLYHHKDKIRELIDQAVDQNFITSARKDSLLRKMNFSEVDFNLDSAVERKIKLWALEASDFLGKLITGKTGKVDNKRIMAKKDAAIKILEWFWGKPRTQEEKTSAVNITFVDDIRPNKGTGALNNSEKKHIKDLKDEREE